MRILTKLVIYVGSIWNCLTPAHAIPVLPKQELVPGGLAIINLQTTSNTPPVVRYQGQRTLVMPDPDNTKNWLTIVGIPLDATVGINRIDIQAGSKSWQQNFLVKHKKYRTEKLFIKDQRKVEPLAEDLAVITAQHQEIINTYSQWNEIALDSLGLAIPVHGRKSSPFGLTRILNDIPKNPHSGLDFAAPLGTKIHCPKDGRVVNIGEYFFNGKIVFIDHGQGFITSYCHLDTILVQKDQKLTRGQVIGTVGKTGRATGPHLHWSVSLNGVRVNPQLFIHG